MTHKAAIFFAVMSAIVLLMRAYLAPEPTKILRIGYTSEPPYSQISQQGQPLGLFPEMAQKIAKELNVDELQWVLLSFDSLIPALRDQRIDLIAAGMTITQSRQQKVCFAQPVVASVTGVLSSIDKKKYLPDTPFLQQSLKLVVINGSAESERVREQVLEHNIMEVEDAHLGLLAIERGKADAMLMTEPSLNYLNTLASQSLKVDKLSDWIDKPQLAAFAFSHKSKDFLERWNLAQQKVLASAWFKQAAAGHGFSSEFTYNENLQCTAS